MNREIHTRAIFLIAAIAFALGVPNLTARAQERVANQKTTAPPESRFEILQSERAVKLTLRIDKFSGAVYFLTEDADKELAWEHISRAPHPKDTLKPPGKVNYQLYSSGVSLQFTFLINVNTGATWQLAESPQSKDWHWVVVSK
jgi:hypothetical protein